MPDSLWAELRPLYSDRELIELCMLVGHYQMIAMTLNALRVAPDVLPTGPPPRIATALRGILQQRRRSSARA